MSFQEHAPPRDIDWDWRDFITVDLFEFLLTDRIRQSESTSAVSRRFSVFKEERRRLTVSDQTLAEEVQLRKIQVVDEFQKAPQKERASWMHKFRSNQSRWTRRDMLLDRFYKNLLVFLEKRGVFSRSDFQKGVLQGYLEDPLFDEGLNVNLMGEEKVQDFFSFVEEIGLLVNHDLVRLFRSFLRFDLGHFLYDLQVLPSALSRPIYRRHMDWLTASSHLHLQRLLLPFSGASDVELRVGVLSWNIAGKDLSKESTFMSKLTRELLLSNLDVITFGFQEIVELKLSFGNLGKMMFQCQSISRTIQTLLQRLLGSGFVCLSTNNLMGLLQLVFLRRELVPRVNWYFHRDWQVKLGGKGPLKMGNKGVVGCMFHLSGFGRLSFVNCHMVHGFHNLDRRIRHFAQIAGKMQSRLTSAQAGTGAGDQQVDQRRRLAGEGVRLPVGRLQHASGHQSQGAAAHSLRLQQLLQ